MRKLLCVILTLALCLSFVASLSVGVSAATSGGANTKTITVETKANWSYPGQESITLKQEKAKFTYEEWSWGKWKTKSGSIYPTYNITIKNKTTGKTTNKTWKNSKITLKLDRNCQYAIIVSYDSNSTWLRSNCKLGNYTKSPYWYVSGAHKAEYW